MTKPEILELIDVHPGTTAKLDAAYGLHRLWSAADANGFVAEVAPGIRGAVTNGIVGMKGELIEALPKLEIISVLGVGVDAVDLATAKARGVRVTNTPDVLTTGVAELALAILLDVARKITFNDRYLRAGRWPKEGDPPLSRSLDGRRMGVLGMGRIGQAVAKRAEVFGMSICYSGPNQKSELAYPYIADPVAMAREVDVLMVTCKGGPETAGLVSKAVIEALGPEGWLINISRGSVVDEPALVDALVSKAVIEALGPEGWLINISRGSVVDEPALVDALVGGRLGAAGLDVFAREPEVPDALIGLDNVVLQPHQGSACEETRGAMGKLVLDNLEAHFAGRPLLTPVV